MKQKKKDIAFVHIGDTVIIENRKDIPFGGMCGSVIEQDIVDNKRVYLVSIPLGNEEIEKYWYREPLLTPLKVFPDERERINRYIMEEKERIRLWKMELEKHKAMYREQNGIPTKIHM